MGVVKSKKNVARRAARLVRLGAGLAGSYLGYQLQRPFVARENANRRGQAFRRDQAGRVRRELQSLRGPIMKVGQAISMQTYFLSEEAAEELSALQMHAPPMHPTLMRAQFKASFGKYPEEGFRSFVHITPRPIAIRRQPPTEHELPEVVNTSSLVSATRPLPKYLHGRR